MTFKDGLDKIAFARNTLIKDGKEYTEHADKIWILAEQYNQLAEAINYILLELKKIKEKGS